MTLQVEPGFEYDVCLSFAGENRPYVEQVASSLNALGIRVFYDFYEQVNLWGKDLYVHLDEVYRTKAQYCVMFVSKEYADKLWTSHERRSAQARAFTENKEYILPVRFDDTEVPGLPPTIGYLGLNNIVPNELAEMIKAKLSSSSPKPSVNLKQNIPPPPPTVATGTTSDHLKTLLVDPKHRIELYDLVTTETEALVVEISQKNLPLSGNTSYPEMKQRIEAYEALALPLLDVLITGCRWGSDINSSYWIDAMERIANSNKTTSGSYTESLTQLSDYPLLFLMYGSGMAAIVGQQYGTFARILTDPIYRVRFRGNYEALATYVYSGNVLDPSIANEVLGTQRLYVPVSERLHAKLREPFRALVRDDERYDELFDRFEFFLAAIHADIDDRAYTETNGGPKSYGRRFWGPLGRFGYRHRRRDTSIVERVAKEAAQAGDQWPPLKARLFDGSLQRFLEVGTGIAEVVGQSGWL